MAFIGILLILAWMALIFFIIVACVILFIIIPCVVLFIVSLVNGIKQKWPGWTKAFLIISSVILGFFLALLTCYLAWRYANYVSPAHTPSSSSASAMAIYYLFSQIK